MFTLLPIITALVLLLQFGINNATMIIYESGLNGRRGPVLTPGLVFCPPKFTNLGFSIECIPDEPGVKTVSFFVNQRLEHVEYVAPFFINANRKRDVFAWDDFPTSGTITCAYKGKSESVRVDFACDEFATKKADSTRATPKPSMSYLPSKSSSPSKSTQTKGNPIKNTSPMPSKSAAPKTQKSKPSSGHKSEPKSEPKSAPKSELKQESTTEPATGADRSSRRSDCVIINAKDKEQLSPGWVVVGDAISYQPKNDSEGVVPGPTAPLSYSFKVPKESKYAVTLDMEAPDITEHNDVWLKFPFGGFILRRFGKVVNGGTGYLKAYHNRAKRATEAFSIDFDPHSFSTANVLKPGATYKIILGARSTKVKVYKIVMFPCKALQCEASSAHWKKLVKACA